MARDGARCRGERFSPAPNVSYLSFPETGRLRESGFSHSGVCRADKGLPVTKCPSVWASADLALGFRHEVCGSPCAPVDGERRFPGALWSSSAEAPSC